MKQLSVFVLLALLALSIDFSALDFSSLRRDVITVTVSGEVENEGEYELDLYSTADDALALAGVTDTSDLSAINPSTVLKDHDVLNVPKIKEDEETRISINTADAEELCRLQGIGPSTAERIIEYREEHGLFQQLEDLMRIKGIGPNRFEKIRDDICL